MAKERTAEENDACTARVCGRWSGGGALCRSRLRGLVRFSEISVRGSFAVVRLEGDVLWWFWTQASPTTSLGFFCRRQEHVRILGGGGGKWFRLCRRLFWWRPLVNVRAQRPCRSCSDPQESVQNSPHPFQDMLFETIVSRLQVTSRRTKDNI